MRPSFIILFISQIFLLPPPPPPLCRRDSVASAANINYGGGKWDLLLSNIGISAMHMQLLHNDKVVIFDRTNFGVSNISLPEHRCRRNEAFESAAKIDCSAHSVEYDVVSNSIRPLMVQTDFWCSSGSVSPDGVLVQTGGDKGGDHVVRTLSPCNNNETCDWQESPGGLKYRRWYATNHILPDGRQIVIGGRYVFNYEFFPKTESTWRAYDLPFLKQTYYRRQQENNLYPFVFLNVDGNLFIFANNRAILFNYKKNTVVRTYPKMPNGEPRCYPSTGSAVLLPLKNLQDPNISAQVLVCGGAQIGAYDNAKKGTFLGALNTCGTIRITDPDPEWSMETMPIARVMGDMVILPNGDVLIINGASSGSAGWEYGRDPVLNPVLYKPYDKIGSRFKVQNPSEIPRMYHSTAVLLRDGRVLVGGSNPHDNYNFTTPFFPTELSLESFSPSYLDPGFANLRPRVAKPDPFSKLGYGKWVSVRFTISGPANKDSVMVTIVAPPFNTHSFSMNQRLLVLGSRNVEAIGKAFYQMDVMIPSSGNLAPSGYYILFVVHQRIPSKGIWVHIQ